jgi:hypothetical protein
MIRQVDGEAVEPIGDHRTGRTVRRIVGPEHEVIDEELRAAAEEVLERGVPFVEPVCLVDSDPRQLLAPTRHLVAETSQLFFSPEQLDPSVQPFIARYDLIVHGQPPVSVRAHPSGRDALVVFGLEPAPSISERLWQGAGQPGDQHVEMRVPAGADPKHHAAVGQAAVDDGEQNSLAPWLELEGDAAALPR